MCVMALITQAIGVNTVLGAFVAGVLIGRIAHPLAAYRRSAARHDHRFLHADLLRHVGPVRRSDHSARIRTLAAADRSAWWRSPRSENSAAPFVGGMLGGLTHAGIAGARLRHECARQHRSHRRHHRPYHGRADAKSLHHDRHHGGAHHHGHAADAALGARRVCR